MFIRKGEVLQFTMNWDLDGCSIFIFIFINHTYIMSLPLPTSLSNMHKLHLLNNNHPACSIPTIFYLISSCPTWAVSNSNIPSATLRSISSSSSSSHLPSSLHPLLTPSSVPLPPQCLPRALPRTIFHPRIRHPGSIDPHVRARAASRFHITLEKKRVDRAHRSDQMRLGNRHGSLDGLPPGLAIVGVVAVRSPRSPGTRPDHRRAFRRGASNLSRLRAGKDIGESIHAAHGSVRHRGSHFPARSRPFSQVLRGCRLFEPGPERVSFVWGRLVEHGKPVS